MILIIIPTLDKISKVGILSILLFLSVNLFSQVDQAYWYNVPSSTIKLSNHILEVQSYLELKSSSMIYGSLGIKLLDHNNDVIFTQKYNSSDLDLYSFDNGEVVFIPILLDSYPSYVEIDNDGIIYTLKFSYTTINLKSNNNGFKCNEKYLGIVPNSFKDPNIFIKLDRDVINLILPHRTYRNFLIVGDTYAQSTLENWMDNITLDNTDITLNVGNIEIYNIHTWRNNGGGKSLFLSFRPMTLDSQEKERIINDKLFNEIDFGLDLSIYNLSVEIDNQNLNIISIQEYYETTKDTAIKSYLIQLEDISKKGDLLRIIIKDNELYGESLIQL